MVSLDCCLSVRASWNLVTARLDLPESWSSRMTFRKSSRHRWDEEGERGFCVCECVRVRVSVSVSVCVCVSWRE